MTRQKGIMVALLVAAAAANAASPLYEDRWFYSSHAFEGERNFAFYRDLIATASTNGYNGLLLARGLEGCGSWGAAKRESFLRLKALCDKSGIEIIPVIWSVGYGTMIGRDLELVESMPVSGIPYVARNGKGSFAPQSIDFPNGDFESFDASRNRFSHWSSDLPGSISFVETNVAHSGVASIRFEPDPDKGKYAHARLSRTVPVRPGHRYRVTAFVRADEIHPGGCLRAQVYSKGARDAIAARSIDGLEAKEGWRGISLEFNAGEATAVTLWIGTWGARSGRFWIDDCLIEEASLREVCRREGTPFVVRGAASGRVYSAGRDYELPRVRMPNGGDISFAIPKGSAIKEGESLLVDAYIPSRSGPNDQWSTCMSDPRLYELFGRSAEAMMSLFAPRKWFLSVDEVRNGNTCPLCTARGTDMAHIFGASVTRMHGIIRRVRPDAVVYAWSDMLDPNHNAHDNYYGTKGTFAGVWNLIPKDIVICCWYRARRDRSLPFFTGLGFRVMGAGYYDYDGDDVGPDRLWIESLNRTPGATGLIYTTWCGKYALLPAFGRMLVEEGRPMAASPRRHP